MVLLANPSKGVLWEVLEPMPRKCMRGDKLRVRIFKMSDKGSETAGSTAIVPAMEVARLREIQPAYA